MWFVPVLPREYHGNAFCVSQSLKSKFSRWKFQDGRRAKKNQKKKILWEIWILQEEKENRATGPWKVPYLIFIFFSLKSVVNQQWWLAQYDLSSAKFMFGRTYVLTCTYFRNWSWAVPDLDFYVSILGLSYPTKRATDTGIQTACSGRREGEPDLLFHLLCHACCPQVSQVERSAGVLQSRASADSQTVWTSRKFGPDCEREPWICMAQASLVLPGHSSHTRVR